MKTRSFVRDGDPKRFWDISWDGPDVEVTSGKWGSNGRCTEKSFETPSERDRYIEARVRAVLKKGYRESGGVAPAADARTPAVEARAKKLEHWLAARRRDAWEPVLDASDAPTSAGRFRGAMTLEPGEAWPLCPSCGRAMAGLFELDRSALPDEALRADDCVQLFVCESWGNDEARSGDCILSSWLARLHRRGTRRCASPEGAANGLHAPSYIVGWTKRAELAPDSVVMDRLEAASDQELEALVRLAGGEPCSDPFDAYSAFGRARGEQSLHRHKLGGWPTFVQEHVRSWTRQLFQLEANAPLHANFGDVGAGHLLLTGTGTLDFFWASH